jgi:hypothetical protein
MDRYQPINPAARRTEYAGTGWTKFDPAAKPYSPSAAEVERMRREYR